MFLSMVDLERVAEWERTKRIPDSAGQAGATATSLRNPADTMRAVHRVEDSYERVKNDKIGARHLELHSAGLLSKEGKRIVDNRTQ